MRGSEDRKKLNNWGKWELGENGSMGKWVKGLAAFMKLKNKFKGSDRENRKFTLYGQAVGYWRLSFNQ